MMCFQFIITGLIVTLCIPIQQVFSVDITYTDCAKNRTDIYLKFLETNYPNLLDKYVNNKTLFDLKGKTPKDERYHPGGRPGTVMFVNAQDKNIQLVCPCGRSDNSFTWKMYEYPSLKKFPKNVEEDFAKWDEFDKETKERFTQAKEFNDRGFKNRKIKVRTPRPRQYFYTFECIREKEHHYFNIFIRPLPKTSFPVQWIEGGTKNTVTSDGLEFYCWYGDYKNTPYLNQPFTFAWKNPNGTLIDLTNKGDNKVETKGSMDYKWTNTKKRPESGHSPFSTVSVSSKKKYEATIDMEGKYECIITDVNGLSSSFGVINGTDREMCCFAKPSDRFGGFVVVHVRESYWVYIPLGAIGGSLVLLVVFLFLCPETHEESESKERVRKDKERKEAEEKTEKEKEQMNAQEVLGPPSPSTGVIINVPPEKVETSDHEADADIPLGQTESGVSAGGEKKKRKKKKNKAEP